MIDKDKIKEDILFKTNKILNKFNEQELLERVSVMNMNNETVFLGNIKIYNENNFSLLKEELFNTLSNIGQVNIQNQRIVPCCSLPYYQITFRVRFK